MSIALRLSLTFVKFLFAIVLFVFVYKGKNFYRGGKVEGRVAACADSSLECDSIVLNAGKYNGVRLLFCHIVSSFWYQYVCFDVFLCWYRCCVLILVWVILP